MVSDSQECSGKHQKWDICPNLKDCWEWIRTLERVRCLWPNQRWLVVKSMSSSVTCESPPPPAISTLVCESCWRQIWNSIANDGHLQRALRSPIANTAMETAAVLDILILYPEGGFIEGELSNMIPGNNSCRMSSSTATQANHPFITSSMWLSILRNFLPGRQSAPKRAKSTREEEDLAIGSKQKYEWGFWLGAEVVMQQKKGSTAMETTHAYPRSRWSSPPEKHSEKIKSHNLRENLRKKELLDNLQKKETGEKCWWGHVPRPSFLQQIWQRRTESRKLLASTGVRRVAIWGGRGSHVGLHQPNIWELLEGELW